MTQNVRQVSLPPPVRPASRPGTGAAAPRRRPVRAVRRLVHPGARQYEQSARSRLRRFRQGSALAVALTAFLLMLWGEPVAVQEEGAQAGPSVSAQGGNGPVPDPSRAVSEATGTIRELLLNFYGYLPRLVLVILLIGTAALGSRLAPVEHRQLQPRFPVRLGRADAERRK